jgi:hypothetical protein
MLGTAARVAASARREIIAAPMNRALHITLLGLALLMLGSCGGGGGTHYSASGWKSCFENKKSLLTKEGEAGFQLTDDETGGEGGFHVEWGALDVLTIVFERTESAARRTEASDAYSTRVAQTNHVLFRKGNVVMEWALAPKREEKQLVEGCLEEATP